MCVNMYWDKLSEQRITNSAHCVVCDLTLTVMCRRYLESGKQVLHEWVNVLHIFVLVASVFYFNFIHNWNSRSIQFLCVFWFLLNKHLHENICRCTHMQYKHAHTHIFATHLILFQLLSIKIIILFAILFHLIWLITNIDLTGELNSVCVFVLIEFEDSCCGGGVSVGVDCCFSFNVWLVLLLRLVFFAQLWNKMKSKHWHVCDFLNLPVCKSGMLNS